MSRSHQHQTGHHIGHCPLISTNNQPPHVGIKISIYSLPPELLQLCETGPSSSALFVFVSVLSLLVAIRAGETPSQCP